MFCKKCELSGCCLSGKIEGRWESTTGSKTIVIVGQNPGRDEDKEGKVFIGDSGKIVSKLVSEYLPDYKVYITNAVKCHTQMNAKPTKEHIKACCSYLSKELLSIKPDLIIVLGDVANTAVLGGNQKIQTRRKEIHSSVSGGFPTLVTYHPAYILRFPSKSELLDTDFKIADYFLKNGKIEKNSEYIIQDLPTIEDLNSFVTLFQKSRVASVDIETTGLSPYIKDSRILTVALAVDEFKGYFIETNNFSLEQLGDFFTTLFESGKTLVFHNAPFDVPFLKKKYNIRPNWDKIEDTLLINYCLCNPDKSLKLEDLVAEYWGRFKGETKKSIKEAEKIPIPELRRRNTIDALSTLWLYNTSKPKLQKDKKLLELYGGFLKKVTPYLVSVSERGVKIDTEAIPKIDLEYQTKIAECQEKLLAIKKPIKTSTGLFCEEEVTLNLNSPKQLKDFLKFDIGISNITGTDKYTLKSLVPQYPILKSILDYRGYSKERGTYLTQIQTFTDENGFLHPSFLQHGTATGRLSSSKPGLQNFPKKSMLRKLFKSRFGDKGFLLEADQSQMELRVLAMFSRAKVLTDAFLNNRDIHTETGRNIFNVEEVTSEIRSVAKTVNFGIVYGITAVGLVGALKKVGIEKTEYEAEKIIKDYYSKLGEVKVFMDTMNDTARKKGYIYNPLGRKYYMEDINSTDGYIQEGTKRKISNYLIQSTASDIILFCLMDIIDKFRELGLKSVVWNLIHDAILFDIYEEELEIVIPLVQEIMEMKRFDWFRDIPLKVSMGVGHSWLEVKENEIL